MQIRFGETVRRLRRERGLTQEQLAQRLNVAFQTISKWERDESYPDITMLPVIAGFFGVRTDDLLGVNEEENERRVVELIEAYDNHKPDTGHEWLPKLKAAVGEYPLDFRLWIRYMEVLLYCARGPEKTRAVTAEAREIYENIDTHCTNDRIRMAAKRLFVIHLHSLDEPASQVEAERILDEMPNLRTCREHVATMAALPGEAHLRACQEELVTLVWMIFHALAHHDEVSSFPGDPASFARAAQIIQGEETLVRVAQAVCPEGDYGKLAIQMVYSYASIAFYQAIAGEHDAAFDAMRCSAELAAAFDAQPQIVVHTSPLLRGLPYDKSPHDRGMAERMRELFGNRYPWPEGFKADPRFAETMALL